MPRPIDAVLHDHTPALMRLPGVLGTAQGARDGRPVILVLVTRRTSAIVTQVPSTLEGWPVEVRETGPVRAIDR